MIFCVDENASIVLNYEDLYYKLSNKYEISPCIHCDKIDDVLINLIYAIINGVDVVLLDSDFSVSELTSLDICQDMLDKRCEITKPISINSHDDLIQIFRKNIENIKIGIFTSGTTGKPKRIDHTLRSLLRNIKCSSNHKSDVWAFAYNVTHYAGIQVVLQAIMNKNPIVNLFGDNATVANYIMEKYKCTHISATPTFYRNFIFDQKTPNYNVKAVTFGGEKFSDNLRLMVNSKFPNAKMRNVYASTEVGSILSGKGESFYIPNSLKSLIKISNDNHLLLHRSLVMHKQIVEDWYDTNDLVSVNENGSFKFLSRDSDFINIGGYKVNPLEVEDTILSVHGVLDATVYGRENSVMGKLLVADVVLTEDCDFKMKKKTIISNLRQNLQQFKVPRIINFVKEIKKSRTGKKVR